MKTSGIEKTFTEGIDTTRVAGIFAASVLPRPIRVTHRPTRRKLVASVDANQFQAVAGSGIELNRGLMNTF